MRAVGDTNVIAYFLLGTEAFVVAWPPRSADDPVGPDLLALPPAS